MTLEQRERKIEEILKLKPRWIRTRHHTLLNFSDGDDLIEIFDKCKKEIEIIKEKGEKNIFNDKLRITIDSCDSYGSIETSCSIEIEIYKTDDDIDREHNAILKEENNRLNREKEEFLRLKAKFEKEEYQKNI